MQKVDEFDNKTTSLETYGVSRSCLGFWCRKSINSTPRRVLWKLTGVSRSPLAALCKSSTGSILRRLLPILKVLSGLPVAPGKKGRWIRYLDDFSGNLGSLFKSFGSLVQKVDGFDI